MLDLIKKLLALLPASLKAVKELLGIGGKVLKTATKLLPKKKAEGEEPKCEGKRKRKGAVKKLGVLGVLGLMAVCGVKTLLALRKAKK